MKYILAIILWMAPFSVFGNISDFRNSAKLFEIEEMTIENLEGRYGIQKQIVTTDEQVYIRPPSKSRAGRLTQEELFDLIWYIEWQVGFEIPTEASYFALSCEYLT